MLQLFFLLVIIPSAIIHEYMHGWAANQMGDSTAKYAGRLTLDPRAHVDLWGTIILPFVRFVGTAGSFLFAYAKPVPYNPYNLRNQKWGPALVAAAGPLSNLFLAFVFGLFVQFFPIGPITPFLSVIVYANVLLAVFNFVPIPPLDGSKILFAIIPDSLVNLRVMLERFGFAILIIFIVFFADILVPIMLFFLDLFTAGKGIFF